MSIDLLRMIADKLISALAKWNREGRVALTGGEPLLKKELFPLLDYLQESEQIKKISILSNGTLLNKEIVRRLCSLTKLHFVQISLDGVYPKTNDAIRGRGSFEKAIAGIRLLQDNDIKVRIMFTLHRGNVEEIPSLIDLVLKEKVDILTIERLVPCGSGRRLKDQILSPEELYNVFRYILEREAQERKSGNSLNILKLRTLWINLDSDKAKEKNNIPPSLQLGASCSIGMDSITILHDGTVLPCRRLNIPIGNLNVDSLFKIWYTSNLLWKIRDKRNLKGKCKDCEFIPRCGGCRAMAYALTGDYLEEDPQCWKKTTQVSGKSLTSMCFIT
jgi:radical SAM protein with 4Fe4S-binding SPASM domain